MGQEGPAYDEIAAVSTGSVSAAAALVNEEQRLDTDGNIGFVSHFVTHSVTLTSLITQ